MLPAEQTSVKSDGSPFESSARGDSDDRRLESEIRKWFRGSLKSHIPVHSYESCMDWLGGILIHEALDFTGGNRSKAARLLGLSRPTLHAKIEKYRLKIETSVKRDKG